MRFLYLLWRARPVLANTPTAIPAPPPRTRREKQVVAIRAAHPGVLLLVEVGYKMRAFGDDARVAAAELGLYCYQVRRCNRQLSQA